jgi:hypothetical protein
MNYDMISQAILGVFIVGGFLVQQWKARQRAEEVKEAALAEAARVSAVAQLEAERVSTKVETAGQQTREQLREISVMVDGRLDNLITLVHDLEQEIDELKGNPPGTQAQEHGPHTLKGE